MDQAEIRELTEQARGALRSGNDVRAVAIADQLLGALPDDPQLHAIRAQGLLSSDNPADALAEAQRAVELNQDDEHVRRVLGLAAWRCEKLTLAQQSLQRAIELSGRRGELLAEYAWFMASQRGPRLAEAAARQAVEADADSSTAWAALGLAQYKLRRRGQAETSLRRALELDPNDLYAQAAMATLLQDQHKDGKAEALADLLKDSPGVEEFVESIHREAKDRRIAKMLVERDALPEPPSYESPRRFAVWLIAVPVMIIGVGVIVRPEDPRVIALCLVVPLLVLWFMRRLLD